MSEQMLKRMYEPDGSNLATMVWGQAGSGKSYFIENTTKTYLKLNKSKLFRMVYVSPKNEGFEDRKPEGDPDKVIKRLRKERFVPWWPYMEDLNEQVDYMIDALFDLQRSNPKMSTTIIIDDAQVFLSARKAASEAHKRLALTGRSKRIKVVYVAHNIVFARELEGQVDLLLGFSNPNPIYYRQSIERFNFDPEPFADAIRSRPYSFVWYDTRDPDGPKLMAPLGEKVEVIKEADVQIADNDEDSEEEQIWRDSSRA